MLENARNVPFSKKKKKKLFQGWMNLLEQVKAFFKQFKISEYREEKVKLLVVHRNIGMQKKTLIVNVQKFPKFYVLNKKVNFYTVYSISLFQKKNLLGTFAHT